ncbi:MAG: RNA-binding S4 domain-containing protein [Acidobacteriota bacterium]
MARLRIDKWLWAARFFKTRSLASTACDLGRISCNGQSAKPSREVHAGDQLHIKNEAGEFNVEVLLLSEMRGPAAVAQALYFEPDESKEARARAAEERKAAQSFDGFTKGRPSKRDRRKIIGFRDRA